MRPYLLDSGRFADFLNRRAPTFSRAKKLIKEGNRLGICPPVIGEFFFGLELSNSPERGLQSYLQPRSGLFIWPSEEQASREYGRMAGELRRIGRPMQHIDIQLAAVAFTLKCIVVSKDSDLRAIPGLDVEDWSQTELPSED